VAIVADNHDWEHQSLQPDRKFWRVFAMSVKGSRVCVVPLLGGEYRAGRAPIFIPKNYFFNKYKPVARDHKYGQNEQTKESDR